MNQYIADLQIHSKYSRAVSKEMEIPKIWGWAKRKGIDLIATGDWTHPLWIREIKANLEEMGNGLLRLKKDSIPFELSDSGVDPEEGPFFVLATEISSIYSQGGKLRRIHNLIWSPSIENAEKIISKLISRGARLGSDGRPIVGLTSKDIADIVFSTDEKCLLIPAHAWTPWFSLFGSQSGFDSIEECFGEFAEKIFAVETGLSSDPSMNWRIKELDNRNVVSFSDAHSGPKLGREATVFELENLDFKSISDAIANWKGNNKSKIAYTIEFFPEEGKYHFSGHRLCQIKQDPNMTKDKGIMCPVCGKKMTIGVMHRVEDLAGRSEKELELDRKKIENTECEGVYSKAFPYRPPFVRMVPLQEIIAETLNSKAVNSKVFEEYRKITDKFKSEFNVLLKSKISDIKHFSGEKLAQGIEKVRKGDIFIDPGYDGVFGVVKIWASDEEKTAANQTDSKDQLSII